MRTCLAFLLFSWCCMAEAHIGSPNVFLQDKAGEYPIRVVIRPPEVVPGLAQVTVRIAEPVQRVTVLPVFSRAGREGSPPPDEARLTRGETNLYSAQLWLMKPGAYSVDVTVEGARGKGTLVVPVNSVATNTRPMARGYGLVLSALTAFLFIGGLKIAGAIFRESRLEPGAVPSSKDRRRGRVATVVVACVFSLLLFGGKKWWNVEDRNYRNNSLYKPFPMSAQVRVERDQSIMSIKVDASERRGRWTPLIPDHGKLMHLFLVRDADQSAFAHLHPIQRTAEQFEVPLPPLPSGQYHVYADVTHEDGFSETLVATAEIPSASASMKKLWLGNSGEAVCSAITAQSMSTNLFFPPDADDSWEIGNGAKTTATQQSPASSEAQQIASASGGFKIIWENPQAMSKNLDDALRFKLVGPDNQPAEVEPYMGMLGHAVVRRDDGSVFTHTHPVGTFSMAAQQFFVQGKRSNPSVSRAHEAMAFHSSSPATNLHGTHTQRVLAAESISFPYAFPKPGAYRLWVQMKSQGQILTGVFDATVSAVN